MWYYDYLILQIRKLGTLRSLFPSWVKKFNNNVLVFKF